MLRHPDWVAGAGLGGQTAAAAAGCTAEVGGPAITEDDGGLDPAGWPSTSSGPSSSNSGSNQDGSEDEDTQAEAAAVAMVSAEALQESALEVPDDWL